MSITLIQQYYTKLENTVKFGKSINEQSIRIHFLNLLNEYARIYNYEVVSELFCMGTKGKNVKPDGILKNIFSLDIGIWESKDEKDSIDDEIDAKLKKGYPFYNILFEDSRTAVLYQRNELVRRVNMRNPHELNEIIKLFLAFKSEHIYKFEEALEHFKNDVPTIVEKLRSKIDETREQNREFGEVSERFLELCRAEINPEVSFDDVKEMMIQHILTADIFNKVFDDAEFHRHNNIAKELETLVGTLFTYEARKNLMASIEHYYDTIKSAAANISDHHEKQKFLKVLYENFYKVYNPKAADRLGVVYTPNEVVNFMVEGVDHLLERNFRKTLADNNVMILDPSTGTGTFISSIIDYLPSQNLEQKYDHEIHANEVAILPYYVANLNIEFTYKQKMGLYREFKNLCFVDTLDNTQALGYQHESDDMFGLTFENSQRIKKQNELKISVIIGNPPYNANQLNANNNNQNREYPEIDRKIKATYIKQSTAQKTKLYDMYARFLRWATDRIDENGIVAFISNNSFIDSRTFDGFRNVVAKEFNEIWILDLKGNARTSGERRRREGGNIFSDSIRVGVAIYFLVKKQGMKGCRIYFQAVDDYLKSEEKKTYLREKQLRNMIFDQISPDEKNNWLNHSESNFEELIPVADKMVKLGKSDKALFRSFSLGVVTARDEWLYDFDHNHLSIKTKFFCDFYESEKQRWIVSTGKGQINDFIGRTIKWTSELEEHLSKGHILRQDEEMIVNSLYRPFIMMKLYLDKVITHRLYQNLSVFGLREKYTNICIAMSGPGSSKDFQALAIRNVSSYDLLEKTQCLPLYWYENGEKRDNITDWGLAQFVNHYGDDGITKEAIFNYTYAVLHDPAYREKYKIDLKRDFPRLPFYTDFWQWVEWGKMLMELHLNFETAVPFPLIEVTKKEEPIREHGKLIQDDVDPGSLLSIQPKNKVRLSADKVNGLIVLDDLTTLTGVPKEAWDYKLGNRSALEWILDQYKEKKPKDPTIAEKFNTYKFADHKTKVIDLLKRVTTVSVETMRIIEGMEGLGIRD